MSYIIADEESLNIYKTKVRLFMSQGSFITVCTTCKQRRYSRTPQILSRCGMLNGKKERCNGIYESIVEYRPIPDQTKVADWA